MAADNPDFISDSQMDTLQPQQSPLNQAANQLNQIQGKPVSTPTQPASTTPSSAQQPTTNPAVPDFIPDDEFVSDEDKYGTTGQTIKAGLEGLARGVAGPLATSAEVALGVKPQDILNRESVNPIVSAAGEVLGFAGPAALTGGESTLAKAAEFTQAGALEKIAAKLGLTRGTTLAAKIGSGAARGVIDGALVAGSDEISKAILNDPNQTAGSVAANIGLSGLMGGVLGGSFGALSGGTSKLGQTVADFRGRITEHMDNPDPVSAMTKELQDHYDNITSMADDVYGATGLKAQEVSKLMPEMSNKITSQVEDISQKLDMAQQKLAKDPNGSMLEEPINKWKQAVTTDNPEQIFNATQNLKQQMQEWGKYNKNIVPLQERPLRNTAQSLAFDLKTALEDPTVWDAAAERQTAINGAFRQYLPALKDFQSKFMTKVGGEYTVDPVKVNTYLTGLDKPRSVLRQEMLQNYIDASAKYGKVIDDTHANLGIDSPNIQTPMTTTMASLEKRTLGAKMADALVDKVLTDGGSKALGASAGAALGHTLGVGGELGALLGAYTLGPFFKSVLPGIAKALVYRPVDAAAAGQSIFWATAAAKAQIALAKTASSLFKGASDVLPQQAVTMVSQSDIKKLDKMLKNNSQSPDSLLTDTNSKLGHYLPDHASAAAQTVGQAVSYLNSLKPDRTPAGPLDKRPVPSNAQKARYTNALNIAENPQSVMGKIKTGTVTQQDIQDLSSMYPALYQSMKQQVTKAMVGHLSKGGTVPYKTRVGLSLFMGQPLDSTMTPQSIQSSQMVLQGAQATQQPQPAKPPRGSKSSPALQKIPNMYATPEQARDQRKNK